MAKSCLICGSEEYEVICSYSEPDRYEATVGVTNENYSRHWVKCGKCGFHFSVYSRDPKILDNIYSSKYRDLNASWRSGTPEEVFNRVVALPTAESETKLRVEWIKTSIEEAWALNLVKKSLPPRRFLDIGGGTGIFAYEFLDEEWIPHVVDANEGSKFIETKLKIQLIQDYWRPGSFSCQFDLITTNFLLEHISDPKSFLKGLHSDMTEDSFLYVEVPDTASFVNKLPDDDIFNSCHLWIFSPNTLTLLLDSCGFEVLALKRTQIARGHYALMLLAMRKL
jgi:hypothetical protein